MHVTLNLVLLGVAPVPIVFARAVGSNAEKRPQARIRTTDECTHQSEHFALKTLTSYFAHRRKAAKWSQKHDRKGVRQMRSWAL